MGAAARAQRAHGGQRTEAGAEHDDGGVGGGGHLRSLRGARAGVAAGTTEIVVLSKDGYYKTSCAVTVTG